MNAVKHEHSNKILYICAVFSLNFNMFLYCKFGNFRENFSFANSVRGHISDVQTSRLRHDLPISVNDRVILLFREGLIFTKLRMCEVSRK